MPAPVRKAVMAKRAAETETPKLWRPKSEEHFVMEEGEWLDDGATTFTYDKAGNILTETIDFDGVLTRITYTYNENNKKTSEVEESKEGEEDEWTYDLKTVYTYDEVLPNLMTSKMEYAWDDVEENWVPNNSRQSQKRDVTRDAKGNITSIELSTSYGGEEWVIDQRTDITYDETTNKAICFDYRQRNWNVTDAAVYGDPTRYKNIEWENTDGQIIAEDLMECILGANRFKSADLYEVKGEVETLTDHIVVTYVEGKDDFVLTKTSANGVKQTVGTYKITDENGSYFFTTSEYEKPEVEEPETEPEAQDLDNADKDAYELVNMEYETIEYDKYGNMVLDEGGMTTPEDEREIMFGTRYVYTYDEEKGVPTELVSEMYEFYEPEEPVDPDESDDTIEPAAADDDNVADDDQEVMGGYEPYDKIVYYDYYDVITAINQVVSNISAKASAIYNLQGVAVDRNAKNMPAGVYVVKQGDRVQKMIKR